MPTENNEKYFYMRLKENFFSSDEIIILEGMQDGYLYSNILLKLYLKSLKNKGKLVLNEFIPYSPTMLAQLTGHGVGTMEKALGLFRELGLIEVLDNGTIYMLDIQNFIGKSSTEADRVRAYRLQIEEEKKLLNGDCTNVRQISDERTPELELDTELDLEKEKELTDKPKEEEGPPTELTDREKERVDLLRDLFASWQVDDNKIFYLSSLVNKRIPYVPGSFHDRDLKIYEFLDTLIKKAKAENVKYIYAWMQKLIPVFEWEGLDYEEELPY